MRTIRFYLLAFIAFFFIGSSWAQSFSVDGINYEIKSQEDLEVLVTYRLNGYYGDISIPQTVKYEGKIFYVTTIKEMAFARSSALTSIDLGNVKTIQNRAFTGCRGLKSIDLKKVETVGEYAFEGCNGLKSADFRNVQTVGRKALGGCINLVFVNLGNVKTLDELAFESCKSLEHIKINNNEPPVLRVSTFDKEIFENTILEVPVGSKGVYKNTDVWKDFKNIIEEGEITSNNEISLNKLTIKGYNNCIYIKGSKQGDLINVYNVDGSLVVNLKSIGEDLNIGIQKKGVYIVKVGKQVFKLSL